MEFSERDISEIKIKFEKQFFKHHSVAVFHMLKFFSLDEYENITNYAKTKLFSKKSGFTFKLSDNMKVNISSRILSRLGSNDFVINGTDITITKICDLGKYYSNVANKTGEIIKNTCIDTKLVCVINFGESPNMYYFYKDKQKIGSILVKPESIIIFEPTLDIQQGISGINQQILYLGLC